jgi:hypothetical protein
METSFLISDFKKSLTTPTQTAESQYMEISSHKLKT